MSFEDIQNLGRPLGIEFDHIPSGDRNGLMLYSPGNNHHPVFVLEDPENGDGPSDPTRKIGIVCYPNAYRWLDCVEAIFPDAGTAITHLSDQDFRSAMVFLMASLLPEIPEQEASQACVVWSAAGNDEIEQQDYTFQEMAETIMRRSGCELVYIPHPVPQGRAN